MAQVSTTELKGGMKVEMDNQPYTVIYCQFVKPGKGQAFSRTRIKNLLTGRVTEKTFRSNEKLELADVEETEMRMLYKDGDQVVFMDDKTFDQINISLKQIGDTEQWLMEDLLYSIIFYNGTPINIDPPMFMDLVVTESDPGVKGDSASGRVMKPAVTDSGAELSIPSFIDQGEKIKVDTRTGEYVSRSGS